MNTRTQIKDDINRALSYTSVKLIELFAKNHKVAQLTDREIYDDFFRDGIEDTDELNDEFKSYVLKVQQIQRANLEMIELGKSCLDYIETDQQLDLPKRNPEDSECSEDRDW